MLEQKTIDIIKSTVPFLRENGTELTKEFYRMLFINHPELQGMFDMEKQKSGQQPTNLAGAILAVAENIDTLEKILPAIEKIGVTHVKKNVLPEQYPIVGHTLLEAMKTILGDLATDELLEAWGKAYEIIAKIFIDIEDNIYKNNYI